MSKRDVKPAPEKDKPEESKPVEARPSIDFSRPMSLGDFEQAFNTPGFLPASKG